MKTLVLCVVVVIGALCEPAWSQKLWRHDGSNPNGGVGADLAAIGAAEGGDFDCMLCADFAVGLADLTFATNDQAARVLHGALGAITDDSSCGGALTFDFPGAGRSVAAVQNPCTGTGAVVAADWFAPSLAINGSTVTVPGVEPGFGFAMTSFDRDGDGVVSEIVISNPFHDGLRGSVVAFDVVVDAGAGCPTLSLVGTWMATGANPGDLFGFSLDRVRDAGRCSRGSLSVLADAQDDIIVGAPGGGYATLLSGSDGTKVPLGIGPAGRFGVSVAGLGDLDGDGCPEVAVGTAAVQTGCGPFVPPIPGLQTTGPFEPGTVRIFRSFTADDVTLHNPLGVTDASFGWSLAGDVNLDLDQVPDFIVGAPCSNRAPMGSGFDGMAFAFSGVPQVLGPPFDWMGSFLGEIPGERMGYSLAVAEPFGEVIPGVAGNGGVEDPCAVVAVGAPWATISGQPRAGRVYGFSGPEQLPVNNNCCASPPCFNGCWVDPSTGFPCAAPTLTITAPTSGTACAQAIDLCFGGPLTFTVSLDPTCLPPGTTSVEFLVLGSAGPVPTSFDSDFCLNLQPCSAYLPIEGDNVTNLLAGYAPAFSGRVNLGTNPATGTLAMNVPPLTSSCAVGIELQFAAAIWVGPHTTGKWVVGTLPASCLELL